MKKGCFVKTIVILTIVVAAVLYIVENKFDDFVIKPGKKILTPLIEKELNKKTNELKYSPEKDSTIALIQDYFNNVKIKDITSGDKIDSIKDSIKKYFKDSLISKDEFKNLKKLLNTENLK